MLGTQDRHTITGMLTWEQPHCQPFRDLIAHPKLIPYLNTVFGHGWRMDSEPLLIASAKGAGGHGLHGCTNRHFNPSYYYTCTDGEIRAGQTVFQLQLRDSVVLAIPTVVCISPMFSMTKNWQPARKPSTAISPHPTTNSPRAFRAPKTAWRTPTALPSTKL